MSQDSHTTESLLADLTDPNHLVRYKAIKLLGDTKEQLAVLPLINLLKDKDQDIRANAARALGEIGDVRAVPDLIEALQESLKHEPELLAEYAIEALGELGDTKAIDILLQALHPQHLLELMQQALKAYTPKVESYLFTGQLVVEISDIRCIAAQTLGKSKSERTVPELIQALNDLHDLELQKTAAKALANINTKDAIIALDNWRNEQKK